MFRGLLAGCVISFATNAIADGLEKAINQDPINGWAAMARVTSQRCPDFRLNEEFMKAVVFYAMIAGKPITADPSKSKAIEARIIAETGKIDKAPFCKEMETVSLQIGNEEIKFQKPSS